MIINVENVGQTISLKWSMTGLGLSVIWFSHEGEGFFETPGIFLAITKQSLRICHPRGLATKWSQNKMLGLSYYYCWDIFFAIIIRERRHVILTEFFMFQKDHQIPSDTLL